MNNALKILSICVVAFFIQLAVPAFENSFVLVSSEVFTHPWTLVTSMFLHGDFMHLFYNMFALGLFGTILEHIIGAKKFLHIYFAGGLIAGLFSIPFYNAVLGASGAIMAILGCLAVLRPKMRVYVGYVPMPMAIAAIVWIAGDLLGFLAPSGIANAAHLGGMVFGLAAGFYLRKKYGEYNQRQTRKIPTRTFNRWEDRWM